MNLFSPLTVEEQQRGPEHAAAVRAAILAWWKETAYDEVDAAFIARVSPRKCEAGTPVTARRFTRVIASLPEAL